MTPRQTPRNVLPAWENRERKTAPESVVRATDLNPGPNRPHLSERGSAVSIMLPSGLTTNNGWRADDLHPGDIEAWASRFRARYSEGPAIECWLWQGSASPNGYGIFHRTSRHRRPSLLAHRVAWVLGTGQSLTENLTIDHLCRVKLCVNPGHMEPVSLRENVRRRDEALGRESIPLEDARARRLVRGMRPKVCATCGTEVQAKNMARHRLRFHQGSVAS